MGTMHVRHVALIAALTLVMAGCGSAGGSATSRASGASSLTPPATATAAPVSSGTAGQTDTEWGRIWDTLPADFPRYAGSTPAEEGATGPASAILVIPGDVTAVVATWMDTRLTAAGYTVDGSATPLEDGSFVLDAQGQAGCRAQVTVAPTGGITTVTVLYGAACPQP
jgi:hypothetical protein